MKKHSVIAFASALTIAAGTICASVYAPAAALDAEGNQIEAAVQEDGSLFAAQDEDGIAYEDAIADLYARSTTISDKEILEIARKMKPDCTAVAEELGDAQAAQIMNTLADYEEAKASYLLDSETAQADNSVSEEWTRQDRYTRMGMSSAQKLTSLIPGYTVTSCSEENGQILVDIDEWMTEGYTEGADQNTENVSAYRYYFTAVLSRNSEGSWEVASITNTDRNFTWLEDIEEQEKSYDGEDDMLFADAADLTADAAANLTAADAATEDLQAGAIRTSSLKTYGDGKYTYSPDKAIAYADKWATSRNPAYRQYPGVDCCNFVSQCLYAGGMPKNSEWYPASYAWINCSGAISNFKKYGKFMAATAPAHPSSTRTQATTTTSHGASPAMVREPPSSFATAATPAAPAPTHPKAASGKRSRANGSTTAQTARR